MENKQQMTTLTVNSYLEKKLLLKVDVCKTMGITRPTLDSRLTKGDWRLKEIVAFEKLISASE